MLTPFHPFSWKWEESALQFYDLIPLGKISVATGMSSTQGGKAEKKKSLCFFPSAFPRLSFLCCRYTKTPTHINICLHTKIFVCGRQPSLPSAYKNKTAQPLCWASCHPANLSVRPFLTPAAALCFLGWTVHCVQCESAHRRETRGQLSGQELGAVLSAIKLRVSDEWLVTRRRIKRLRCWGLCVQSTL